MTNQEQLEDLYQQMASLTHSVCLEGCSLMGSCCSELYCRMAIDLAKRDSIVLSFPEKSTLLLDSKNRCIAAPHHRPLCSLHVCDKLLFDKTFSDKYFNLRDKIDELENTMVAAGQIELTF